MSKKLFATVAAFVLVLTMGPVAPPASAANAVVEVPGHAGLAGAGLWYVAQQCNDVFANPNSQFAETPVKDAGVRGTHALGWKYPTTGNEVGVLAHVPNPMDLDVLDTHVRGANGPGLTGHVLAIYDDSSANFQGSRWIGQAQATVTAAGWVPARVGDWRLTWYWYAANGTVLAGPYTLTVQELADARATNGSGAYVGFAWGCDGQQFFMDALTVGNTTNSVTYDYEGLPSASRLQWWAGKKPHDNDIDVGYGSKFFMLGDSYDANGFIVGAGTFFEKRYGDGSFVPVKTAAFDLDSYAAYKVTPKRQTTYWFSNDGSDAHEGSVANTVTVRVAHGVSGRLQDDTLRPGQRAVVTGALKPGNRGVKVSLQRKLGGGWKTVATTRSRGGGAFTVGVKARAPGTMTLRLSIAKGKGNLGTKTNSVKVTVKPRPRPDPPGPGGGGGGSTTSDSDSIDAGNDAPPPYYKDLLLLAKTAVSVPPPAEPSPAPSASCAVPIGLITGSCANTP